MYILGADQTYEENCGHLLSLMDMAKLAAETIMLNTFSIDLITQVTKCFFRSFSSLISSIQIFTH